MSKQPAEEKDASQAKKTCREEEYLDGWKRAKADYANLKKEMDDERQKAMFYSKILILADLLPVISNLQKATGGLAENKEVKGNGWAEGFVHIAKQFESFLEEKGVKRIVTEGTAFNPEFHEAVEHEAIEGTAPGTIIKEIEPGYTLNDSVIVAARVIVAK